MKQHTKTSMQEKPLQANGLRRLPNDAIGFDFCLITKMDGRKIKSIFPAGTPRAVVHSFFKITGSLL